MPKTVCLLVLVLAALGGCTAAKPLLTPQEYQASCRSTLVGADAACLDRVCDAYQETVTDYYDTKVDCVAACKAKAERLLADVACPNKVAAAREACLDYCQRKFYRCNCDKVYTPGVVTN